MESRKLAQQIGSDAYISKPFDAKVLIDKINELLAKKEINPPPRQINLFIIFSRSNYGRYYLRVSPNRTNAILDFFS